MRTTAPLEDYASLLIDRQELIEAVMAQYLAGTHQGCATDDDRAAAHLLLGVVLASVKDESFELPPDPPLVRRHASRFGDGLVPILKDLIGPDASDAFLAHCSDRYWNALRARVLN